MKAGELYGAMLEELKDLPEKEEELIRIFMHVLNMERHEIILSKNTELGGEDAAEISALTAERKSGRPLAYILGYTYFYGMRFPVSEETLIPRYDTELLPESLQKYYKADEDFSMLDICTGTGIIALTAAVLFPRASIKALDIVEAPFYASQKYLSSIPGAERVQFERSDFLDRSTWRGEWDCICSNPPYLSAEDMDALDRQVADFEPASALYAEHGGLMFYEMIAEFSKKHLKRGGMLFLETDYKHKTVAELFSDLELCLSLL